MTDTLYKFVTKEGTTSHEGIVQNYSLPILNDDGSYTPGEWVQPQDRILALYEDTEDCGANRLHLMKSINAIFAPKYWVCYIAEGDTLVGESDEKASYQRVRLLEPVDIPLLAREGRLKGANLQWIDLQGAYLLWADLHGADLHGANLQGADLLGVDLQGAYLRRADFQGAYLHGANLWGADLLWANLTEEQREYAVSRGAIF